MMLEAAVAKIHKEPAKVESLIGLARENAKEGLGAIRHSLHLLRSHERPKTSIQRIQDLGLRLPHRHRRGRQGRIHQRAGPHGRGRRGFLP